MGILRLVPVEVDRVAGRSASGNGHWRETEPLRLSRAVLQGPDVVGDDVVEAGRQHPGDARAAGESHLCGGKSDVLLSDFHLGNQRGHRRGHVGNGDVHVAGSHLVAVGRRVVLRCEVEVPGIDEIESVGERREVGDLEVIPLRMSTRNAGERESAGVVGPRRIVLGHVGPPGLIVVAAVPPAPVDLCSGHPVAVEVEHVAADVVGGAVAQRRKSRPGRNRMTCPQSGVPDAGRSQRARRQHEADRQHDEGTHSKTSHEPSPVSCRARRPPKPARPLKINSSSIRRRRNRHERKPLPGPAPARGGRPAPPISTAAPGRADPERRLPLLVPQRRGRLDRGRLHRRPGAGEDADRGGHH